jgi:hypothetical protein
MDEVTRSKACDLLSGVARFGNRISNVLHEYASLETYVHHNVSTLLSSLNATIHSMDQLCNLLSLQEQPSSLLNDEGLKYIESLAEECSVAISKVKWTITGNNCYEAIYSPGYWKSPVSVDGKGQKVLLAPDLDEAALFRDIKNTDRRTLFAALRQPAERLDYLKLLLLLVVQVMTVQKMTNQL